MSLLLPDLLQLITACSYVGLLLQSVLCYASTNSSVFVFLWFQDKNPLCSPSLSLWQDSVADLDQHIVWFGFHLGPKLSKQSFTPWPGLIKAHIYSCHVETHRKRSCCPFRVVILTLKNLWSKPFSHPMQTCSSSFSGLFHSSLFKPPQLHLTWQRIGRFKVLKFLICHEGNTWSI